MSDALKRARTAVGSGRTDDALVLLWNELEPARLRGDRRALATIQRLATHIAQHGDASQQRDAERLLDALRRLTEDEGAAEPAVARVEGDYVAAPGTGVPDVAEDEADPNAHPGRVRIGSILWILFVLGIIIFNALNQGRG